MQKKAIFITGAGAGIGLATARHFASRGWFVGAFDLNETAVQELRGRCGEDGVMGGRLDVIDAEGLRRAVEQFSTAAGGRLDVMFNNAGIAHLEAFENVPLQKSHAIVDVNLKGLINGAYAALPHLQRTPGARMISMGSASSIYGAPQLAVYSATKFAVKGLTEALDLEWAKYGIRVMDLCPLFVATDMVREFEATPSRAMLNLGVHLTADDIAANVWSLATRPAWRCPVHSYPGLQAKLLALASKLSPAIVNRWANKMIQG